MNFYLHIIDLQSLHEYLSSTDTVLNKIYCFNKNQMFFFM